MRPRAHIERWTAKDYANRRKSQKDAADYEQYQRDIWANNRKKRWGQGSVPVLKEPRSILSAAFELATLDTHTRRKINAEVARERRIDDRRKEKELLRKFVPVIINNKVKLIKRPTMSVRPEPVNPLYNKHGTNLREWFSFDNQGRTYNLPNNEGSSSRPIKHGDAFKANREAAMKKLIASRIAKNKAIAKAKLAEKRRAWWKKAPKFNFQK